jgi:hypothetical protein
MIVFRRTILLTLPDLLEEYDDLDRDLDIDLCFEALPPGLLLPTSSTTVIWLSESSTFVSACLLSPVSSTVSSTVYM